MIKSKAFWKGYFLYTMIVMSVLVILLFVIMAVGMSMGINKDRTSNIVHPIYLVIRYVFGFPIGFFLDQKSLGGLGVTLNILGLQPVNCFIQFSIISFLRQSFKRR